MTKLHITKKNQAKKLVVFHNTMTPYRIDFFNSLASEFKSVFYFNHENLHDNKFDQSKIQEKCFFEINILRRGFDIGNKFIRFDIIPILQRENPDVVICQEYSPSTFLVLLYKRLYNKNLKVLTISDDNLLLSIKRNGARRLARLFGTMLLDGIIFPSKQVCDWYNLNIKGNAIPIEIPIVHKDEFFRHSLPNIIEESSLLLKNLNLKSEKIFLFVGRLVKEKNIDHLIREFASAGIKDSKLIIVGSGVEANNLKKLVSDLKIQDKVLFVGRDEGEGLKRWYMLADYLVLPSIYEPYGVVVNEALLCGCKVICSSHAGSSVLIDDRNGYVFDPKKEHDLRKILIKANVECKKEEIGVKNNLMPFRFYSKITVALSTIKSQMLIPHKYQNEIYVSKKQIEPVNNYYFNIA